MLKTVYSPSFARARRCALPSVASDARVFDSNSAPNLNSKPDLCFNLSAASRVRKGANAMMKKIQIALLICALGLTPSRAVLAEYDEICLRSKAGFVSSFVWAFAGRDNPNALDTGSPGRNIRDGVGVNPVRINQTRCFNLSESGAQPGDRLRFYVKAHGGRTVRCRPGRNTRDTEEGVFLNPDGPRGGRLTFYSSGSTLSHGCHLESGERRMHSGCNASLEGMLNTGCAPFRPAITPDVLHDIVENDRGLGMLGSALRNGADVLRENGRGESVLHVAARLELAQYIPPLLSGGARAHSRDNDGATTIISAVGANPRNLDALRALLTGDISPNLARDNGDFPLYIAAQNGRDDIVRLLTENGANINAAHPENGLTALGVALERGHERVIEYLRERNADEGIYDAVIYNIIDRDWGLHRLRDALNRGADPNFADENGETALHLAAGRNRADYANDLIFIGAANRDAQNRMGQTPLMALVAAGHENLDALRLLVAAGAQAGIPQSDGVTPLYSAVLQGRKDMVEVITLDYAMDINARNPANGLTAYGLAESRADNGRDRQYERIRAFLERRGGAR